MKHKPQTPLRSRRFIGLGLGLFILGLMAIGWLLYAPRHPSAQLDDDATRDEYDHVISAAARANALDVASEIRLHWALYHKRRLLDDLFSFTNQTAWNLLPSLSLGLDACRPQSETLFELGQINDAEHMAHEALEYEGERPETLRLLALINVLKDRPNAAKIFLNVLSRTPAQQAWARDTLRRLEADPHLSDDPELARVRSLKVSTDAPHKTLSAESLLLQLLQSNATNQMAFEYLLAHYLLTRQVDKLVTKLRRLDDFKYDGVPRHCEEAVLVFQEVNRREVDLRGRQIRPETRRRFERFLDLTKRRAHETAEGRQSLMRDFGDTFWFYLLPPAEGKPASTNPAPSQ